MMKFMNRVFESVFINGGLLLVVTLMLLIIFAPPYLIVGMFLDSVGYLYVPALALYWLVAYRYLKPIISKYVK